jgi:uncharacterized membrane protein
MAGTGMATTDDVRTAKRAAMRRATLHLVLGVVLLHAIAMLTYYAAIVHAPERARMIFTGIWTALTALVVAVLLGRVRRVRRGRY